MNTPNNVVAEIVERVRISDIAEVLGVKLDRTRRRGVAGWRKGKNFSVSLNDSKNVWHDFVTSEGGGVLDFIARVRGRNRKEAIEWLAAYCGVPLDDRPEAERRDWARQMREAKPEAEALVRWKLNTLEALREQRGHLLRIYHRAKHFIITHDLTECEASGDLRLELALSVGWSYWPRIREARQGNRQAGSCNLR